MNPLPFLEPQNPALSLRRGLALVGLPRSGKTTLGQALAQALHWPFVDSDQALAVQLQCPVATYIKTHGIEAFRQQETRWLHQYCNTPSPALIVLSTGGGLPCHDQLMDLLNAHFVTVYLTLKQELWFERLFEPPHELSERLTPPELQALYTERHEIYSQAQYPLTQRQRVDTDVAAILAQVLA